MKIKFTKLILASLLGLFGFSALLLQPAYGTEKTTDVCKQLTAGSPAYEANGCGKSGSDKLSKTIMNIINVVLGIVGIIAVIYIIIGGINYMTSLGDPGKVQKAKNTILYAIIGLVVVILAGVIVNFVISAATKPAPTSSEQKTTDKNSSNKASGTQK